MENIDDICLQTNFFAFLQKWQLWENPLRSTSYPWYGPCDHWSKMDLERSYKSRPLWRNARMVGQLEFFISDIFHNDYPLNLCPNGGKGCMSSPSCVFLRISKKLRAAPFSIVCCTSILDNVWNFWLQVTSGQVIRSIKLLTLPKKSLQLCPACSVCQRGFKLDGLYDSMGTSNLYITDFL